MVMNQNSGDSFISDDEEELCPLCVEEMDLSDKNFKPCPCGYQVCQFCYNNIRQNPQLNGKCPACRRPYSDETVEYRMVTQEEWKQDHMRQTRKERERKQREREKKEEHTPKGKHHLSGMRVIQKNLVYVIGLNPNIPTEDLHNTLRGEQFFGQYGKIQKIVINRRNNANGNPGIGVYVTFSRKEDAARCIAAVDGSYNEGKYLRAAYGTTKYCSSYLRGQTCPNPNCMFLHEPGEEADSYTRQDLSTIQHAARQSGFHHQGQGQNRPHSSSATPPPQAPQGNGGLRSKPPVPVPVPVPVEEDDGSALPATASWAQKTNSPVVNNNVRLSSSSGDSKASIRASSPATPSPSTANSSIVTYSCDPPVARVDPAIDIFNDSLQVLASGANCEYAFSSDLLADAELDIVPRYFTFSKDAKVDRSASGSVERGNPDEIASLLSSLNQHPGGGLGSSSRNSSFLNLASADGSDNASPSPIAATNGSAPAPPPGLFNNTPNPSQDRQVLLAQLMNGGKEAAKSADDPFLVRPVQDLMNGLPLKVNVEINHDYLEELVAIDSDEDRPQSDLVDTEGEKLTIAPDTPASDVPESILALNKVLPNVGGKLASAPVPVPSNVGPMPYPPIVSPYGIIPPPHMLNAQFMDPPPQPPGLFAPQPPLPPHLATPAEPVNHEEQVDKKDSNVLLDLLRKGKPSQPVEKIETPVTPTPKRLATPSSATITRSSTPLVSDSDKTPAELYASRAPREELVSAGRKVTPTPMTPKKSIVKPKAVKPVIPVERETPTSEKAKPVVRHKETDLGIKKAEPVLAPAVKLSKRQLKKLEQQQLRTVSAEARIDAVPILKGNVDKAKRIEEAHETDEEDESEIVVEKRRKKAAKRETSQKTSISELKAAAALAPSSFKIPSISTRRSASSQSSNSSSDLGDRDEKGEREEKRSEELKKAELARRKEEEAKELRKQEAKKKEELRKEEARKKEELRKEEARKKEEMKREEARKKEEMKRKIEDEKKQRLEELKKKKLAELKQKQEAELKKKQELEMKRKQEAEQRKKELELKRRQKEAELKKQLEEKRLAERREKELKEQQKLRAQEESKAKSAVPVKKTEKPKTLAVKNEKAKSAPSQNGKVKAAPVEAKSASTELDRYKRKANPEDYKELMKEIRDEAVRWLDMISNHMELPHSQLTSESRLFTTTAALVEKADQMYQMLCSQDFEDNDQFEECFKVWASLDESIESIYDSVKEEVRQFFSQYFRGRDDITDEHGSTFLTKGLGNADGHRGTFLAKGLDSQGAATSSAAQAGASSDEEVSVPTSPIADTADRASAGQYSWEAQGQEGAEEDTHSASERPRTAPAGWSINKVLDELQAEMGIMDHSLFGPVSRGSRASFTVEDIANGFVKYPEVSSEWIDIEKDTLHDSEAIMRCIITGENPEQKRSLHFAEAVLKSMQESNERLEQEIDFQTTVDKTIFFGKKYLQSCRH